MKMIQMMEILDFDGDLGYTMMGILQKGGEKGLCCYVKGRGQRSEGSEALGS